MQSIIRRDPPLSARAATASNLEARKRDRLARQLYSEINPVLEAQQRRDYYAKLASRARMFGH